MSDTNIQQSKYTLSKMSIVACIVIVAGLIVSVQGVINRYHLAHIQSSYQESEIKRGRYIECDISRGHLVGLYYTELNGEDMFSPYGIINTDTNTLTCLVAVNDSMDYYVSLKLPSEYQEDFAKIIQSDTDTLHIIGKFQKKSPILFYDKIALCLGIDDESVIRDMVSNQYQIKTVNPKKEKSTLLKGFLLLAGGLVVFYITVKINED
ncbi:MAG: hypothetical protein J1F42_06535 [Lachnospiraceae bacterium]|nr:hypothetical protein [Lachnospiraceae bacterium]